MPSQPFHTEATLRPARTLGSGPCRVGVMSVLLIAVTFSGMAGEELLPNTGFEEEAGIFILPANHPAANTTMPKGWSMNWSFWGTARIITDRAAAHSGERCLAIYYEGDPQREKGRDLVNILSDQVHVIPGKQYLIRLWVKGGALDQKFDVACFEYTVDRSQGPACVSLEVSHPICLSHTWQLYRGIYPVRSANAESVSIAISNSDPEPLLIDDVSLTLWDGRPLLQQIKESPIETARTKLGKTVLADNQLKAKYWEPLNNLYQRVDVLKGTLSVELPAEAEEKSEKEFDAILREYQSLAKDIKMNQLLRK